MADDGAKSTPKEKKTLKQLATPLSTAQNTPQKLQQAHSIKSATMVLLDESPTDLLRETTSHFYIAKDRDSLSRIHDSLTSLSVVRQKNINDHHAVLKSLSRRLNGLEEGRRWEEDRHDAGGHAERMLKMDTEKFRIAKGVSDAEIEGERLEGELVGLRAQAEVLERQGVESAWRRDGDGEDETMYVYFHSSRT